MPPEVIVTVAHVRRSSLGWKVTVLFGLIGVIFIFAGVGLPQLAMGRYLSALDCGEVAFGLWQMCSRTCGHNEWKCVAGPHETDIVTASRVLLICGGVLAFVALLLAVFSKVKVRATSIMLAAAIIFLLASLTSVVGIGLFLRDTGQWFQNEFGPLYVTDFHTELAGGLTIAAVVLLFLNVGFCFVEWTNNKVLVGYEDI